MFVTEREEEGIWDVPGGLDTDEKKCNAFMDAMMKQYDPKTFYTHLWENVSEMKQGAKQNTRAFVRDMAEKIQEARHSAH